MKRLGSAALTLAALVLVAGCGGPAKPVSGPTTTSGATTVTTGGSTPSTSVPGTFTTSAGSGPTPTSTPDVAAVVGNGKHYSFSGASVATSQFPNACDLLPTASVRALFGISQVTATPMPAGGFTPQCGFQVGPQVSGFGVDVMVNAIGTADGPQAYQSGLQIDAPDRPRAVSGIGQMANVYQPGAGATSATIDVLSGPVEYSIGVVSYAIDTPVPSATIISDTEALARAIAPEFS